MTANALPNTYPIGMIGVLSGLFALAVVLTVVELVFESHGWPSLGYRLESWSRDNRWFAAALLLLLGALAAHFTCNPWPPKP